MERSTTLKNRRHKDPIDTYIGKKQHRYFDPKHNRMIVRVQPGEHYVSHNPEEMIVTVLGSCVAACIRDPETGIGGMNHFMLPESNTGHWGTVSATMRYGNFAMEALINEILKTGCPKERLEVKLFGGGNISTRNVSVGNLNGQFALNYLKYEDITLKAHDLGGLHARRIHYSPSTGKVDRLLLKRKSDAAYLEEENAYRSRLPKQQAGGGEIDLF